jgi:putative colanic acid biosynthesis acetyltransferase WcaF
LFRTTPKQFNSWRLFLLRSFGAQLSGVPFVHPASRIWAPWYLVMEDRACLGEGAYAYNLAPITLRRACTVAQEVYLCAGTHDFASAELELVAVPIEIGAEVFIGARAFVLPGVKIGERAVIGAAAVVTRDIPAGMIAAGNPCKVLKPR